MKKSKFLHFQKVQENPEKSKVLEFKSNQNSQSYNEITKIDDFSQKKFFLENSKFFLKKFFLMFETKIQLMLFQRFFICFKSYRAQNFRNWLYFVNLLKNLKSCGLNKPKIKKIDFGLFYIFL